MSGSLCAASVHGVQLQSPVSSFNYKTYQLGRDDWRKAAERLSEMYSLGLKPDQFTCSIVVSVAGRRKWRKSCDCLEDFRCHLVEVNTVIWGAHLTACEKGGQWQTAASLLLNMKPQSLEPSLITGNGVITYGKSKWTHALGMMSRLQTEMLRPDRVTCSAMMTAFDAEGSWERAFSLLQASRGNHMELDVTAWTSLIGVCAREGGQWKRCLDTLACMAQLKCRPNVVSFRTAYFACELADTFQPGQDLLKQCSGDPAFNLWAAAKLGVQDPQVVHGCCLAALEYLSSGSASASQIAAVCWAASALGVTGMVLEQRLQRSLRKRLGDFTMQELTVLAWSFVDFRCSGVLHVLQEEACRRLGSMVDKGGNKKLLALLQDILGLVGACAMAGFLHRPFQARASRLVHKIARSLDTQRLAICPLGHVFGSQDNLVSLHEPSCRLDLGDRVVVYKPAGWEVHDLHEAMQLHDWIKAHYLHVPILRNSELDFGFLHRLDVPSSGLLLVAKSCDAFHEMQMQLALGQLERCYVVLCHGWLPKTLKDLTWQLRLQGEVSLAGRGKPCRTSLHSREHLSLNQRALSLVNVTIATGRMHQIRCHLAHAGHPTVSDGKYTGQQTFGEDLRWCPRNFLHRHTVIFQDSSGRCCAVTAPPATDLEKVVECVDYLRNKLVLCVREAYEFESNSW